MHIHDAILKAADQIEQHPELFDFIEVGVPRCGSPGCALGWITFFSEPTKHIKRNYTCDFDVVYFDGALGELGLLEPSQFYDRMDRFNLLRFFTGARWTRDAQLCAKSLRKYAKKYHPKPKYGGIPTSVLGIFKTEVKERDLA